MLYPIKVDNPLIVKPLHYSEEEIEGIYQIFKDEEKRQSETNPFTVLFEEKGFSNDALKDFLLNLKNHNIRESGKELRYEELFIVDGIKESAIQFAALLYELLYVLDRRELPKYLNYKILGRFAHWRILTKK